MANTTQQGYEEIDLIELIIKIYKFFKKRKMLIVISVIIAVSSGILSSFLFLQPRYQSTMIISSRSLTGSEIAGMMSTLNSLADEENKEELELLTKIPQNLTKNIAKIEAVPNRDYQKNVEKDLRRDSTIAIKLEITKNQNWSVYQEGFAYFLENNPYVKKKNALYKAGQERLLKSIQKEIKHIDSLKKIIEASGAGKIQLLLNSSGGWYSDVIKLYDAENTIKENLAFANDIQIIKGFTNFKRPQKYSMRETLSFFAVIGLILGVVVALLIELSKVIRKREGKE